MIYYGFKKFRSHGDLQNWLGRIVNHVSRISISFSMYLPVEQSCSISHVQ